MIEFPNAKINLGLNILNKRSDGFHNIQTVLLPIGLCDALEIIPATQENIIHFSNSGLPVPLDGKPNLCIRAFELLQKEFGLPGINIHLHKKIPTGSGLGGGSSNAAFTLKMVNKTFALNINNIILMQMAASLGSDCPFFIENKPMLANGRGEILEPIEIPLTGMNLVLIKADIHIGTAEAYANVKPAFPKKSIAQILEQPIDTWKHELKNDFETNVFERFPLLKKIKENLYSQGAEYAAMTGSGSAIFGLFKTLPQTNQSELYPAFFVWQQLLG